MGFDLVPRSPLNSVQMPAKANRARSSFNANHTTSFLPVAGLGSGAYSAKLLAGTRQRLSGFSQPRQCGEVVLRISRDREVERSSASTERDIPEPAPPRS